MRNALSAAAISLAIVSCADEETSFEVQAMQEACGDQGIETCASPDVVRITDGTRGTLTNVAGDFTVDCNPNGGGTLTVDVYEPFDGVPVREIEGTPGACFDMGAGAVWAPVACDGDTIEMVVCDSDNFTTIGSN
jgi:hypothetical protein